MSRKEPGYQTAYDPQYQRYLNEAYEYHNNQNARNDYARREPPVTPPKKKQSRRNGLDGSNMPYEQYFVDSQQYVQQNEPYYGEQFNQPNNFSNNYNNGSQQQQLTDTNEPYIWQQGPDIGRGAYGVVYQGLNVKTGAFMAVKKLKFDDQKSGASTEVLNEIKLMSNLNHENIVQYYSADQQENHLYIFMEFVPGGSIARLLKHFKRLHESVIRQYTKKILAGLQYLHHNNIVHGDIKAANILVSNDGVVKLSDFGHSRVVQHGNSIADTIRGTPMWMAPEVITDSRHGKPSDIWSLGCTVIEMFTGDLPWPELVKLEPFAIMYKIAQTKTGPELPEDVSEEGADFLRRCFDVNCKTRATVDELLQHPFVTKDMDCWTSTPQSQMSVISTPEPIPRRSSAPAQIPTVESISASHSIQSELLQLTERVDRILQEQSKPHNSRIQSSPIIGAEHMSPIASRPKRKSQPVESYSSYVSQPYSSHQTYMSQQSFISQQQPSFMPQFQRSRFSPPEDGEMSTEYMYSPQKGM